MNKVFVTGLEAGVVVDRRGLEAGLVVEVGRGLEAGGAVVDSLDLVA